jgi:16S rRNA (guanine(966)-N(2))-methyltransferase RsmD
MKILTGSLRGQSIAFKANPHLRPTADKVRQAIFNTLKDVVCEARVLDLFSGTGALGIESLSMGADYVVFVEKDKPQARKIEENLIRLDLTARAKVFSADALECIDDLEAKEEKFSLIFLDPPYHKGLAESALYKLGASSIVLKDAIVVAEGHWRERFADVIGQLEKIKEKEYGDTRIAIYRHA